MKKVLFSDYDQTFYLNDQDIELNKKQLLKFQNLGNLFVITTGRSFYDFNKKKDKYKFKCDYVILNHGSVIIDRYNNVLFKIFMEKEIVKKIQDDLEINSSVKCFCCGDLESRLGFDDENITKIYIKYSDEQKAEERYKYLSKKYKDCVNIYHISSNSIEIISNKTSKKIAIEFLISKLKINKNNVYTIGDGYSDIDMVKEFNGYCMTNSVSEIKKYARKEYESVSNLIIDILGGI